MQSRGEGQYCILETRGESVIDVVSKKVMRHAMFSGTLLEVHFSAQFIFSRFHICQIDWTRALVKWNILKTFLPHGDKRPQKYFYFDQGDQTERGERQGENYSFDEENMRRDLDVMGRVTWYNMCWHPAVTFGDPSLWLVNQRNSGIWLAVAADPCITYNTIKW